MLVVGDEPIRWRLATPARWLLLAIAMAVDTFTGIVLMQGTHARGDAARRACTSTRSSDTRTGGAIMWFGGDAIMAVVMIVLVIELAAHASTPPRPTRRAGSNRPAPRRSPRTPAAATTDGDTVIDDDDAARDCLQRVAGPARPRSFVI